MKAHDAFKALSFLFFFFHCCFEVGIASDLHRDPFAFGQDTCSASSVSQEAVRVLGIAQRDNRFFALLQAGRLSRVVTQGKRFSQFKVLRVSAHTVDLACGDETVHLELE